MSAINWTLTFLAGEGEACKTGSVSIANSIQSNLKKKKKKNLAKPRSAILATMGRGQGFVFIRGPSLSFIAETFLLPM